VKHPQLMLSLALSVTLWVMPCNADLVVVVSADNPTRTLDRSQLADLYLGRRDRFPDGETAVPVDLRENSAAYARFYERHLEQTPAQIRAHWSRLIFTGRGRPPRTVTDGRAMADTIASNPRFIGYLDDSLVDERLKVVDIE